MKLRERLAHEVRDWRHSYSYHANGKRHAKPKARGGTLVIQRSDLPRPVIWSLLGIALFLLYVLGFGGIL